MGFRGGGPIGLSVLLSLVTYPVDVIGHGLDDTVGDGLGRGWIGFDADLGPESGALD